MSYSNSSSRIFIGACFCLLFALIPSISIADCEYVRPSEKRLCQVVYAARKSLDCVERFSEIVDGEPSCKLYCEICEALKGVVEGDCKKVGDIKSGTICRQIAHGFRESVPLLSKTDVEEKIQGFVANPAGEATDLVWLGSYLRRNYPLFFDSFQINFRKSVLRSSPLLRYYSVVLGFSFPEEELEKIAEIAFQLRNLQPSGVQATDLEAKLPESVYVSDAKRFKTQTITDHVFLLFLLFKELGTLELERNRIYPKGSILGKFKIPSTIFTDQTGRPFVILDSLEVLDQSRKEISVPLSPIESGAHKQLWFGMNDRRELVVVGRAKPFLPLEEVKQVHFRMELVNSVLRTLPSNEFIIPLQVISATLKDQPALDFFFSVEQYYPMESQDFLFVLANNYLDTIEGNSKELIVVNAFTETLKIIDFLHKNNLLHRDIKHENLLFYWKNGLIYPRLIDFEFLLDIRGTKLQGEELKNWVSRTPQEKLICGSHFYLSPQKAQRYVDSHKENAETTDPISRTKTDTEGDDIWAAGVTLYLMSGDRPSFLPFEWEQVERAAELSTIKTYDDAKRVTGIEFSSPLTEESVDFVIKGMLHPQSELRLSAAAALEKMTVLLAKSKRNSKDGNPAPKEDAPRSTLFPEAQSPVSTSSGASSSGANAGEETRKRGADEISGQTRHSPGAQGKKERTDLLTDLKEEGQ